MEEEEISKQIKEAINNIQCPYSHWQFLFELKTEQSRGGKNFKSMQTPGGQFVLQPGKVFDHFVSCQMNKETFFLSGACSNKNREEESAKLR